ncbi:hypothetical protein C1J03_10650 [Sulfitobacter sp. SK012]|uniref:ester cyclase n=1 Tax=Sulfitobacter sp. SK012 TaxID=1389005 RepID=UPI000E0A5ECF|nr:ester cyclase [Sulfitobacter sp. SK012]AXI46444.1 hypothetical protein C1J03_10650 [Sulfitobacter sp. SK012]
MLSKVEILAKWYREVWEDGNLDVIESYFNIAARDQRLLPGSDIEPSEIREWVGVLRGLVDNIQVRTIHSIEQGDWLSAILEISCSRRSDGAPIKVIQQIMLRFDGDKKAETYPLFDFLQFFEQLGLLPHDVHALLLAGTKFE